MQLHRASEFSYIRQQIKDAAIENLWKGIEQGQSVDMLTERLHKRQAEKEELETQLAIENNKKICLSEAQILAFLDYVCEMPFDDFNKRRAIINIFVQSIYLYDDHFTLIINASKKPLSIDNIQLDDIEEAFEGENTETEGCSSLMTPAPPEMLHSRFPHKKEKSERGRSAAVLCGAQPRIDYHTREVRQGADRI